MKTGKLKIDNTFYEIQYDINPMIDFEHPNVVSDIKLMKMYPFYDFPQNKCGNIYPYKSIKIYNNINLSFENKTVELIEDDAVHFELLNCNLIDNNITFHKPINLK